jgi:hypothetical protein
MITDFMAPTDYLTPEIPTSQIRYGIRNNVEGCANAVALENRCNFIAAYISIVECIGSSCIFIAFIACDFGRC